MLFEEDTIQQLKIYFLFMYADGKASASKRRYVDDMIKKSDLSEEGMEDIRAYCKKISRKLFFRGSRAVIAEIDALLGAIDPDSLDSETDMIVDSEALQALTVWTLIRLGYADSEYSKEEKKVVAHLVDRWRMDSLLIAEMNDTAETILALTLQKEWVQKTYGSHMYAANILQELDRNIASMYANMETSISEAYIAQEGF